MGVARDNTWRLKMKTLCLLAFGLIPLCMTTHIHTEDDLDDNDRLDEDEFEEAFDLKRIYDPAEKAKRAARLAKTEEEVKEENEDYIDGKASWYAKIYETADRDPKELVKEMGGGKMFKMDRSNFGTGGLMAPEHERYDEKSHRYFEEVRSRGGAPASYDARKEGLVPDPRPSQGSCGSCVAFATVAMVEVCIKKAGGGIGDFAEQQLVDCGYGKNGCDGCGGAQFQGYAKWIANNNINLTHESTYPYQGTKSTYRCPRHLEPYNMGARVTDFSYKYDSDEESLKQLVFKHGAVVVSVNINGWYEYGGGIFDRCWSKSPQHGVTVVGYGSERGRDFWIIRNSWGEDWGEGGYMRMARGRDMCGINKVHTVVTCSRVPGPTSSPLTTKKPCFDKYNNCQQIAVRGNNCAAHKENCMKSCGLCEGMTPHKSVKCPDAFTNCRDLCPHPQCKASCGCNADGGGGGNPNCNDYWNNCAQNLWYCDSYSSKCKKTCGKC